MHADDLSSIRSQIEKRGRDETNIVSKGQFKFLHSRLAINNFGKVGKQPIVLQNGSLTILFNGEIYNFKELSKAYYNRHDINDTVVLGKLISDYGVNDAVAKFNGMYSIVVYDHSTSRVYCARDQFGQKPLFYSRSMNKLRISSSIKALAILEQAGPSENAFKAYSSFGYFPCPDTAYEGISQFVPGTITEIDAITGEVIAKSPIRYRSMNVMNSATKSDRAVAIFEKMASRHAYDGENACLMLSGGVDSTLVSTFMVEHGLRRSFSVGFPDYQEFDETADAVRVASVLGLEHTTLDFSQDDYFRQVQNLGTIYEQPLGDSSALPTSLLVKAMAGSGYKVAYGGDGGDELFFGYKRHQKFGDIYKSLSLLKNLFKAAEYLGIKFNQDKIKRLLNLCRTNSPSSFILQTRNLSRNVFDHSHLHHDAQIKDTFTKTLKYFDIESIFSNDSMVKTDRPSMHYGIEVRNPLIDFDINMLSDLLINSDILFYRKNKNFLKDVIRMKNPHVLKKSIKKGFSVPVDIWIRNEWKDWASDLMSDFMSQRRFDYDYEAAQLIFDNHMNNQSNSRDYIWSILMYQNWINST